MLGVDAGERRIGIAMSDPTRLVASPLQVLRRDKGLAPVLDALTQIVRNEEVARIVVGLPLNADGSEGRQAKRARNFAQTVERVVGLPVQMWDERLSTRAAEDILRAAGRNLKRVRQRGELDSIAAAAILQDYLDHHATSVTCEWSAPLEGQPSGGNSVQEGGYGGGTHDGEPSQT